MTDKIVPALVTGIPAFIGGVLHLPGEIASANLTELGVKSLDDDAIVGLEKAPAGGEQIAVVPIAAVAPHAPDPSAPQGVPPGTVQSPTGRLMAPTSDGDAGAAREFKPADADVSEGPKAKK